MVMKSILRLFLVVFCFALVACSGSKQVVQSESNKEVLKEHKIFYKDTLILTPSSLAEIKIPAKELEDRTPRTYHTQNGNASADVQILHDTIKVTAKCDSLAIRAQIKQELIRESEKQSTDNSVQEHTGVSRFTLYLYAFIGFVVGIVAGVIIKIFLI